MYGLTPSASICRNEIGWRWPSSQRRAGKYSSPCRQFDTFTNPLHWFRTRLCTAKLPAASISTSLQILKGRGEEDQEQDLETKEVENEVENEQDNENENKNDEENEEEPLPDGDLKDQAIDAHRAEELSPPQIFLVSWRQPLQNVFKNFTYTCLSQADRAKV